MQCSAVQCTIVTFSFSSSLSYTLLFLFPSLPHPLPLSPSPSLSLSYPLPLLPSPLQYHEQKVFLQLNQGLLIPHVVHCMEVYPNIVLVLISEVKTWPLEHITLSLSLSLSISLPPYVLWSLCPWFFSYNLLINVASVKQPSWCHLSDPGQLEADIQFWTKYIDERPKHV